MDRPMSDLVIRVVADRRPGSFRFRGFGLEAGAGEANMGAKTMTKKTVLVVDDEPDVTTYLCTLLEDHGYATCSAADGEEALERVRASKPDLITLDISMPEKSGVRFYRDIREDENFSQIPVIMVTGVMKEFEGFIKSRKQVPPPDGYIQKPIDEEVFLTTVKRLLSDP